MSVAEKVRRLGSAIVGDRVKRVQPSEQASAPLATSAQNLIAQLDRTLADRVRLVGYQKDEQEKISSLGPRVKALEAARLDALTEHRVSGSEAAGAKAAEILTQMTAVRQEISDASGLMARLDERIRAVDLERAPLKHEYEQARGAALDEMYRLAAEDYQKHAQQAGAAVVRIAAIHRVMMKVLAGNSNGWDGSLLLPRIVPGDGAYHEPLFQAGAAKFGAAASEGTQEILNELRAAGFRW